jgi:hypothetical protein
VWDACAARSPKVAVLTGVSVASAVPIALAAGRGQTSLGLALLAVLFVVLNFALVVRQRSLSPLSRWPPHRHR